MMITTNWTLHTAGRTALLRFCSPLSGGPDPDSLVRTIESGGARDVLLDTTNAAWADSDGLRWLLALHRSLQAKGHRLKVVARRGGRVWRNVTLLNAGFVLFPSVRAAWHG